MTPIAHHAGEQLVLTAALGSGLLSASLLVLRVRLTGDGAPPAALVTVAPQPGPRAETEEAFLDAAERLLIEVGYAEITTRRLAYEAGANPGLVHYYFGSMENLFVRVLERFTERLISRQRAMYARDVPFIEKWRAAMSYMEDDLASGYPKVWLELQALGWNRPDIRERVASVSGEWRAVLSEAFSSGLDEYRLDRDGFPLEAWVTLVYTFNVGIEVDRLSGVDTGHRELLQAIDRWLEAHEKARKR